MKICQKKQSISEKFPNAKFMCGALKEETFYNNIEMTIPSQFGHVP